MNIGHAALFRLERFSIILGPQGGHRRDGFPIYISVSYRLRPYLCIHVYGESFSNFRFSACDRFVVGRYAISVRLPHKTIIVGTCCRMILLDLR